MSRLPPKPNTDAELFHDNLETGDLDASLLTQDHLDERFAKESAENTGQRVDGPLRQIKKSPREYLSGALAVASVATAIPAIITSPVAAVITAGLLGCGLGPYGYYQQTQLEDITALTETRKKFEVECNRLHDEVVRLERTKDDLIGSVNRLYELEDTFWNLTQSQDQSVTALEEQIDENRKAVRALERLLRILVLQNLVQVMIACDINGDYILDEKELDDMILKVKDINGVNLEERKLREEVKEAGGSIETVIKDIKKSLEHDMQHSEFFTIGF